MIDTKLVGMEMGMYGARERYGEDEMEKEERGSTRPRVKGRLSLALPQIFFV